MRPDTPQVVDESHQPMSNHRKELDDNDEPVNSQKQQLEGTRAEAVILKLVESEGEEQDNPHEIHQ